MKRLMEPRTPQVRAARMRSDANECEAAGFPVFAAVNREMAEWLDPTPRERPVLQRRQERPDRMERVMRVNQHAPSGTRVVSQGPSGRVLARKRVA